MWWVLSRSSLNWSLYRPARRPSDTSSGQPHRYAARGAAEAAAGGDPIQLFGTKLPPVATQKASSANNLASAGYT
jgi:hypothetical protein